MQGPAETPSAPAPTRRRIVQKIDITPDVSLIQKAGAVNYKIPDALAELADNSVDARLPGRKLHIELTLGQKKGEKFIEVLDDGRGMTPEAASKAMVMAYSAKEGRSIGEFGFGMKTACSNLGHRFEIVTATGDSHNAARIIYDEREFIRKGRWELLIEELEKPFDQGTLIRITDLKVNLYAGSKDVVLKKFGKIFKHFVASGEVEIVVNGDAVEPVIPDTIKEYDTEIKFEVNGRVVRGWASLATKGSGKNQYGFDLVRHNRVMVQYDKTGFTASAGLTRLVGELHLDDFPVVNNKTDFRRDTAEWHEMERRLNEEFLVDLKRESRKMANPGKFAAKDQAEVEEYIEEVQEALRSDGLQQELDRRTLDAALADEFNEGPLPFPIDSGDEESREAPSGSTGDSGTGGRTETTSVGQHRLNRVKTQLRSLRIEHQIARLGPAGLYKIWDIEGVASRKRLVVTTNQDHAMYSAMEGGFMLWVKHNIVEAVAEFFTQETGQTDAMLSIKSDILKYVHKMQLEIADEPTYPPQEDAAEETA